MTPAESWLHVDDFLTEALAARDDVLDRVLAACVAAGLPPIQVSAPQGKLLHLLARMIGARRILEIGTLGGYSAVWMGRALPPGGQLVTLENDALHARVARENLALAGLAQIADVRLGPALGTLDEMIASRTPPFDLVFIDADKPNNPGYLDAALALTRPGSVIVLDNIVRDGTIADPRCDDPAVLGTRECLRRMNESPRLCATGIQTVGAKGYDGFAIALVAAGAS
jgi:predicted O-methyltransferase YrrM